MKQYKEYKYVEYEQSEKANDSYNLAQQYNQNYYYLLYL